MAGPVSFTDPVPQPKLYFRPGESNVGSVRSRQPPTSIRTRWAADVGEPEVTHAGFGTLECSLAHESTKSATSSQPSCTGKWHRPDSSRESVPDAAWRCFLKLARVTDGGQMRSSVPGASRSGGRLGVRLS